MQFSTPARFRLALRTGVGLAAVACALPVLAQTQPEAAATAEAETETQAIVVTGSRIARPDIDGPVPVVAIGADTILADGAQNVSDILNELPQVGIGSTRTNSNFLTSGTGIATVNLRGLGSSRTLTLVNGRRFIGGFAGDSSVDLNNIPTDLIERVEVVTGGSSAVYGSDAVAGVVNFIMKDSFEGISVRAQASVTGEGDNPRQYVSVTGGTTFGADDRGNIMANFSYDRDDGLFSRNRAISDEDCNGVICGPAAYSSFAPQGQFQLRGPNGEVRSVLPGGGSTFSFNPDNSTALIPGLGAVGFGYNRNGARYISVPLERYLGTVIGNYEVTDNVTAFAEVTYARVISNSQIEPFALDLENDIFFRDIDPFGIPASNPFIPDDIAAAIAAANSDGDPTNDVDAISGRRRQNDVFDRSNQVERQTWRVAAGLRGDVGKFDWETSFVYGHLNDFNSSEDIDNNRYRNALNAVRVGPGNVVGVDIVCADAQARSEGCIPLNLFGFNTADPRAASYVQAVVPKSEEVTNEQYVVNASLAGPLFTLPAGDVGIAAGAEYRRESTFNDLDILTNTGGNSGNLIPDLSGAFDVWEVFGEVNVPILSDKPFFDYLGLIGAARYSDYSTIGGVFSWNAGAEWAPTRDIRFRGVYAVANRAPNISELFSAPSETFAAVNDPCDGTTATNDLGGLGATCRALPGVAAAIAADGTFDYALADLQGINGFVGGNPDLEEETAKTLTIGAVVTPSFVRGLSLTVDYYDIKIDGAIATLGRNNSIQRCLETGLDVFCDNVIRDQSTGFIETVNGQLINVASLKTRGVDVGVRYRTAVGIGADDSFQLSGNYTYLIDNKVQTDPTEEAINSAGTFGRTFSTHSFTLRGTYEVDFVRFSWQTNFLSGGPYVRDFINANPAVVALNDIDDYATHDAQLSFNVNEDATVFFNVDNVFDKKPQYLPGAQFGTPTGLETAADFDVIGRRFTAGARFNF
ncbi:TonB-dependent receptor domain-containing protein [Erythrobacter sp. R86502]|uniref:TonB-dependent receptor domain-containing protein n=1 Tax=Erythrobacter sp. R86502 TaxID=3093846 RepID=UPI0036D36E1F